MFSRVCETIDIPKRKSNFFPLSSMLYKNEDYVTHPTQIYSFLWNDVFFQTLFPTMEQTYGVKITEPEKQNLHSYKK